MPDRVRVAVNWQTVLPDLDVITVAAKAAHTQSHVHYWIVELAPAATRDEVP